MLLHVGLSNALVAALLAVGVALIGRVARRPALVHSLWLLVLLKLITPPLVSFPIPALAPPAREAAASEAAPAVPYEPSGDVTLIIAPAVSDAFDAPEPPLGAAVIAAELPEPREEPAAVQESLAPWSASSPLRAGWTLPSWPMLLMGVWAAGSVLWSGLAAWRIVRFGWLVGLSRPAPLAVRYPVEQLSERLAIAASPPIRFLPASL